MMSKYVGDALALTAPAWILMFITSVLVTPRTPMDLIAVGIGLLAMPFAISESYETWKKYEDTEG
jgi:hypothetical protein